MATQHQQKEACPMKKILFLVFTIILCLSLGACSKDTSLNLIPTDPPTTVHTHTPGAVATCTEDQTCTICGEILTVATGHIEIIDSAIAPTCTSTGLTEGAHCSVCGIILKQQEVLPEAHTLYQHKCTSCDYEDEKLVSFDVSPNKDGTIMAHIYKTAIENEYLVAIYGTGEMKNYNISSAQAPYETLQKKIKYIEIGEGITRIGDHAFACWSGEYKIKGISLPSTLVEFGENAFEEVDFLTYNCEITIPESVTRICSNAFYGTKISKLALPNSVTHIEERAFCAAYIQDFQLGDGITFIGEEAFSPRAIGGKYFHTDTTFVYENGIYIGTPSNPYYMLIGTESKEITSLEIHPDTHFINDDAVYECIMLTDIVIPEKVQNIGLYAFGNCLSLKTVAIKSGLTYLSGHIFYGCENLTAITLPDTIKQIGHLNFAKCYSLTNIVFAGKYDQWKTVTLEKGWGSIDPWNSPNKKFQVTLKCTDTETVLTLPQVTIGH
jgi:hypothetical protein